MTEIRWMVAKDHGPGGGWPIVRFIGTDEAIRGMLERYTGGPELTFLDDEDTYQVVAHTDRLVSVELDIAFEGDDTLEDVVERLIGKPPAQTVRITREMLLRGGEYGHDDEG